MKLEDIWMRDPFIFSIYDSAMKQKDTLVLNSLNRSKLPPYWLYGTTDKPQDAHNPYAEFPGKGFDCYYSWDLIEWKGPFPAFRKPENFWADTQFWAPEVYLYQGRIVMFATMKKSGKSNERGVAILESRTPEGPFQPVNQAGPITPKNWACLDGTLFIQESQPWMVFCREWTQVGDGQMYAMKLSDDLSTNIEEPILLFSASDATWTRGFSSSKSNSKVNFITDGPFVYKSSVSSELIMLWSSIAISEEYSVGIARSPSGNIEGPWEQDPEPLYQRDGGHAMVVNISFPKWYCGPSNHYVQIMSLHQPNRDMAACRPVLLSLMERLDESTSKSVIEYFDFQ